MDGLLALAAAKKYTADAVGAKGLTVVRAYAAKPASPVAGDIYYNEQDHLTETYNGTAWSIGTTPNADTLYILI